jgi:hypothetical protein
VTKISVWSRNLFFLKDKRTKIFHHEFILNIDTQNFLQHKKTNIPSVCTSIVIAGQSYLNLTKTKIDGERRGGGQEEGGDSGPWVTAVSVKNNEQSRSSKSIKSGGSISHRVKLFSPCRSGLNITPFKKRGFHQSPEFRSLVSTFESNRSKLVSVECCVVSEHASLYRNRIETCAVLLN